MIVVCTIAYSGKNGLQKSVLATANALHRGGHPVALLGFLGVDDGARTAVPTWPIDEGIPALTLQTLAADGGALLHSGFHPVVSGTMGTTSYGYKFTENQLAVLRQLNAMLDSSDTIIFTSPVQSLAFARAIRGLERRPRTVLQIHGDYRAHPELQDMLMASRDVIDRLRVIASGLREQFIPEFAEEDVLFIPNFQGDTASIAPVEHDYVNIALPASFQPRKNQVDAVLALSKIEDSRVHLTFWGEVPGAGKNPYYDEVVGLVDRLGLNERVHMAGFGTERDVYSTADIVLMTSVSEGFGRPLIESAYHEIPAVAYDFEFGPRDIIADGESGFIVPMGDVDTLAERLGALAKDPELRRTFGTRARTEYQNGFSTEALVARYETILGPPSGRPVDLVEALAPVAVHPIPLTSIHHAFRSVGGHTAHQVVVDSPVRLHDVQIDNGSRVRSPRVFRFAGKTHIVFHARGKEVITFATAAAPGERHYLANTNGGRGLEVRRYLRGDADYGDGDAAAHDRLVAQTRLRELPRHPRFPVMGGVDSFGVQVNQAGGVTVRNGGTTGRPTVTVSGEYDWLVLRDTKSERHIASPFTYGELFDRICQAEREFDLFSLTVGDGIRAWELMRPALIATLAESLGLWASSKPVPIPVLDAYEGSKRLTTASTGTSRILFDRPQRGGVDQRTRAFHDSDTLVVVHPDSSGYPTVDDENLVYPMFEFNEYRRSRNPADRNVPDVDARPFEEALTRSLGLQVNLGTIARDRISLFLDQRDFWTPVLDRLGPTEVLIPGSCWWPGVAEAASRTGGFVSDIQFSLTGRYHPIYWYGGVPAYGAKRFYGWSDFWTERTNLFEEKVISPRGDWAEDAASSTGDPVWDVVVVSQPTVSRRIMAFVQELVRKRPELKVVVAPHPNERPGFADRIAAAGLGDHVSIVPEATLDLVKKSAIVVGCYSTTLWEAAALGRPTYVIPAPGFEMTLEDIERGLFRLAGSVEDIVPYDVPAARSAVFGAPVQS